MHLRFGAPFHQFKSGYCEKKNLPFQLQSERSAFALGSFRLVCQFLFRFLFHSTTMALDLKNVLVHQGIDKQANVVSRACFSRARLKMQAFFFVCADLNCRPGVPSGERGNWG